MGKPDKANLRRLILVLGDQLDGGSAAFADFDAGLDAVLMMEVKEGATYIPQHKLRLAFSEAFCFAAGVPAL